MTEAELNVRYGYAWRSKVGEMADEILMTWARMGTLKRLYWQLRGKAPGTRAELVERIEKELLA